MPTPAKGPSDKKKVYGFNLSLKQLERAQNWQNALTALHCFAKGHLQTRISPDVVSYTTVLRMCARREHWLRALSLFEDMKRKSVVPSLITYSTMIDPIGLSGGWQALLDLLEELSIAGLAPDLQFLNASISACARISAWPLSLGLFNQVCCWRKPAACLTRLPLGAHHLFSGLEPDSYTFNAVISSCAYGSAWQIALACLHEARLASLPESPWILTAASSACALGQKWQIALELAQDARSTVEAGDKHGALISLGAALKACERGSQWALACHAASAAMQAGLVDTSACCAAVSACEKAQQWQHAICLACDLVSHRAKPNALLCGAVISSCEYSQKWALAMHMLHSTLLGGGEQVFLELASEGRTAGAAMPVAAAMSCCSKARRWEAALYLLGSLQQGGAAGPVPTAAALEACSKASQWQRAELLLATWQTDAESSQNAGAGTPEMLAELVGLESALLSLEHCGQAPRALRWRGSLPGVQPITGFDRPAFLPPAGEATLLQNQTTDFGGFELRLLQVVRKLPRRRQSAVQLLSHVRHMLAGMRI